MVIKRPNKGFKAQFQSLLARKPDAHVKHKGSTSPGLGGHAVSTPKTG